MKRRLAEWVTGAAVLGGLAAFYVWHGGAAALYILLLAGMVVLSGVLLQLLGPRRFSVKRQLSQAVISAGEATMIQVQVEFSSWLPVPWLAVEDYYTGGSSRRVLFPWFRRKLSYSFEFSNLPRGVYSFDACLLEWGGLFGWFKGERLQKSEGRLLVLPKPLPLGNALAMPKAASMAASGQLFQTAKQRQGVKGPEVREYMPSDPLNRIHWKSSAKRGKLQTLLPEEERNPSCLLILDRSFQGYTRSSGSEEEGRKRAEQAFEKAVSAAAAILGEMMRTGSRGKLIYGTGKGVINSAGADAGREEGAGGSGAYSRMLAELSPVTLAEGPALPMLLEESMKYLAPGTRVIIITGMMDNQTVDTAARLAARGVRADFYCTAIAEGQAGTEGRKTNGDGGTDSPLAAAIRLSASGAGIYAIEDDPAMRIGLAAGTLPSGEGAV